MNVLAAEGDRPKVDPQWLDTVKKDIQGMFRDRRNVGLLEHTTRADVEFLLSMGLHVNDVGDRRRVLLDCLKYVYLYGGPQKHRDRELSKGVRR